MTGGLQALVQKLERLIANPDRLVHYMLREMFLCPTSLITGEPESATRIQAFATRYNHHQFQSMQALEQIFSAVPQSDVAMAREAIYLLNVWQRMLQGVVQACIGCLTIVSRIDADPAVAHPIERDTERHN